MMNLITVVVHFLIISHLFLVQYAENTNSLDCYCELD